MAGYYTLHCILVASSTSHGRTLLSYTSRAVHTPGQLMMLVLVALQVVYAHCTCIRQLAALNTQQEHLFALEH